VIKASPFREGDNPFAVATWTQTWDFTSTSGGWYGDNTATPGVVMANYAPGEGWTSTTYVADAMYHAAVIGRSFQTPTITSFSVTYTHVWEPGISVDPRGMGFISYRSQAPLYRLAQVSGQSGPVTLAWYGWMANVDQLWVSALAGIDGNTPYSDPGGRVRITSITLTGEGPNPFLEDE
jgi:hypothetical protein